MKTILFLSLSAIGLLCSCQSSNDHPKVGAPHQKHQSEIILSAEQIKAVGIRFGYIEEKNLTSVVKASGYLEVPPQNKAQVSSLMGAIVKTISIREGDMVRSGQLLATLQHPDFIKMQEAYITERNTLLYLEKEYTRQKELSQQNAGTGKIYEKSEAEFNSSKARLSSLEKQLSMLSVDIDKLAKGSISSAISLLSPINGSISHIKANIGMFAEPGKTLFEIVDNSKIHCDLLVYEKDLFKVKPHQKVHFLLANLPEHQEMEGGKTIDGEIFGINKSFENDTKALTVHATITNENHELIPGMFVNAHIETGNKNVLAVPIEAVVQSAGKSYLFLRSDTIAKHESGEFKFMMIEIMTGVADLGYIEISAIDPIPEHVQIVISNPFFLLSKSKEGEESGEH